MQAYLKEMTRRIVDVLKGNEPTLYLYGSVTTEDFRPGWSDVDILCLTREPINATQAEELLMLRQRMVEETGEAIYRAFEGGMLSLAAFMQGIKETVVYWGTSGQRITDSHSIGPFCTLILKKNGRVLHGQDQRADMADPTREELVRAVRQHFQFIRSYGKADGKPTAVGWLLDTARCLYTLQTDDVLPKTKAGEWALEQGLAPEPAVMRRALEIRKAPLVYLEDPEAQAFAAGLTPSIEAFADVLEEALIRAEAQL